MDDLKNNLTDFSKLLFASLPSFDPSYFSAAIPAFNRRECELLKMFLWLKIYIHLSQTFNFQSMEEDVLNPKFIRSLLIELINDDEYTLDGIAYAMRIPSDVVHDIVYGINTNPSTHTSAQIIWHYIIAKRTDYTENIRRLFQLIDSKVKNKEKNFCSSILSE